MKDPLAVRMRPQSLGEFFGQEHLMSEGKLLRQALENETLHSLIIFGPTGCGKTTLAMLLAETKHYRYVSLTGGFAGTPEIKKELLKAREQKELHQKKTILFVDEIHRLNKLQQDVFIPDTENGTIILIGATTANPFFSINPALISRSLVCEFKPINNGEMTKLLMRAWTDKEKGLNRAKESLEEGVLESIADLSNGDARKALNTLEIASLGLGERKLSKEKIFESIQKKPVFYDSGEEYHYDVISAFIKSVRGSDVDAALYWLALMLEGGEDPRFIARRLVILASEDIGNADPFAFTMAVSLYQACEFIGMPEIRINLSQTVCYMALAPKSNASYMAIEKALADARTRGQEEVPDHLKDSHYTSAKKIGRGLDYLYPHDYSGGWVKQEYKKTEQRYYFPSERGREKTFAEKIADIQKRKQ